MFSDDDSTDRKALGSGEGDRNKTLSQEDFSELMTRGNWKELGFSLGSDTMLREREKKTLILIHVVSTYN